jgi:hypothetical protein
MIQIKGRYGHNKKGKILCPQLFFHKELIPKTHKMPLDGASNT